ncbi:acyltransferase [Nocardioides pelophilus]|uniref:acyltransferase n=1 Tax=Nocardioides pelophilus TaxID=2172019 RepID=UPI0016021EF3|nr:hypothetical protein [Nocardioides pelophilus]
MRQLLTMIAFLLPSSGLKIRLLNLLGHQIHPTARIGICFVQKVGRFELAEGVTIGNFNAFRFLARVQMGLGSRIVMFNWILGGSGLEPGLPDDERGIRRTLRMGAHSHVMSFHFLDCGGGLLMADETWLTGLRSTVLTHAFDPHEGGMILEPVELKRGAVVSTSCTMLPGTVIGEGALLAAGSTLWTRQELAGGSLYGGVPARRLSAIQISDWVYNRRRYGGQNTF